MPTYQYQCTACGHRLDAVQSFSDAPLTVCPECEGSLRKLFSSVGVVFKGSGFYRTDSRTGSSSGDSTKSPSSSSSEGGSSSSSSSSEGKSSSSTPNKSESSSSNSSSNNSSSNKGSSSKAAV